MFPIILDLPSTPPLEVPASEPPTNTLALLLPHLSLFSTPVLTLLRDYYEGYGSIAHWAPVKGFGRVIIVYHDDESAGRAKKEGDWLRLDVDVEEEVQEGRPPSPPVSTESHYFSPQRKRSQKSGKGLVLRLYTLPPTTLNQDPAKTHLAPPNVAKNFLISPPGSPPEGWEPIIEDAPNSSTLAEDLARALQAIQLNGRRRNGGKEVIFEGEGVRVEVEDCTVPEEQMDVDGLHWAGVEEAVETNQHGEVWEVPSQIRGNGTLGATHTPGLGGLGAGTPGGRIRVAPTAMPPLAE